MKVLTVLNDVNDFYVAFFLALVKMEFYMDVQNIKQRVGRWEML